MQPNGNKINKIGLLEMNNLIGPNPEKAKYEKSAGALKQTLKDGILRTKTQYIKELKDVKL